jgi:hypothetical protein
MASSAFAAAAVATRRGKHMIVPRSASLPANCVKCGTPAQIPWRKKFYWHSPWLYITIVFPGLLVYIIVAVIVRKQMELNLPLCDAHNNDRKRYFLIGLLMLIGFLPIGLILGFNLSEALGWITGVGMFIAGVVFWQLSTLGIRPVKIDDARGVFSGIGDAFLTSLPEQQ